MGTVDVLIVLKQENQWRPKKADGVKFMCTLFMTSQLQAMLNYVPMKAL